MGWVPFYNIYIWIPGYTCMHGTSDIWNFKHSIDNYPLLVRQVTYIYNFLVWTYLHIPYTTQVVHLNSLVNELVAQ